MKFDSGVIAMFSRVYRKDDSRKGSDRVFCGKEPLKGLKESLGGCASPQMHTAHSGRRFSRHTSDRMQIDWQAARHFRLLARKLIHVLKISRRINEQAVFLDKAEQFQVQ